MKRVSMALVGVLVSVLGMLGLAGAAAAAPAYPPVLGIAIGDPFGDGCLDLDTGIPVQVNGLEPGSKVTIKWKGQAGAPSGSLRVTDTDTNGIVNAVLPVRKAGTYTVTATSTGPDGTKSEPASAPPVEVLDAEDCALAGIGDEIGSGSGGTSTAGLADTGGAGTATLLTVGVGALLLGGMTVVVARTRRWGTDES